MEALLNQYKSLYQQEIVESEEDISGNSILQQYTFKLPLEYHKTFRLSDHVKSDIEFGGESNMYEKLLNHTSLLVDQWSSCYTTNKKFLIDNQTLLSSYSPCVNNMNTFKSQYVEFKEEQNFLSKYQYVQFRRFFYLNTVVGFLQLLALYNICSPIMSLCAPLLGLIVPYFVFYFKGIKLPFRDYIKMVKTLIFNNKIVRNILNFRKTSLQQKLYVLVYLFFYCLGFYNNIMSCIQFYKNTNYMIDMNTNYTQFLDDGNRLISHIHGKTKALKRFREFNATMLEQRKHIHNMGLAITSLKKAQNKYIKCGHIGLLMKSHFDLYYNKQYHDTIMYLIYLNQYHQDMTSLSNYVQQKTLHPCTFIKKKGYTKLQGMYYLSHIKEEAVKNNISFNKNIIITGPNASGKTTILKATFINLFLSQSIGVGCYKKCKTKLYDTFHSYLNIPDTSNRDSLFQAEARRCKTIFENIQKNQKANHLCIFDEIYSGTNPSDAVLCANIYLEGMNTHKSHVDYVLTTHYLDLCEKYKKNKCVKNQQMKVICDCDDSITYTYTLDKGISNVHGGLQILQTMDYPDELMKKG